MLQLSNVELPLAGQILLALLALVAAVYDIRFRRIPNWLILAGIIVGFAWNGVNGGISGAPSGLLHAFLGFILGFILYFPLYLLRARGAGDVKLLAAAGSIVGAGNCLWLFLLTAILGGIAALLLIALKGRTRQTLFNVSWILRDLLRLQAPWRSSPELDVQSPQGLRLPHAVVIAAASATLIALAQLHWRF